jgi:N-acetylglutamate synthase-like GNAT family acetyltransferase
MSGFQIRPLNSSDTQWIAQLITKRWKAEFIVAHGKIYHPRDLPGFIATKNAEKIGLITYDIKNRDCEIISLDSLEPSIGVGTALVEATKKAASEHDCSRLWLTTTNDNLKALRFYQKRGFVLVKIHRNMVEVARLYKPIPLIGNDGIPIRDEIELEMKLKR